MGDVVPSLGVGLLLVAPSSEDLLQGQLRHDGSGQRDAEAGRYAEPVHQHRDQEAEDREAGQTG
ncbi:hypothetical protein [Isoptericola croceus]|uniref:hypothetical protein n=1 Tax=Isoptericola croceus TaxID=3031406 RepID=UPI0023F88AB7|nr:hypothetical protein [Isoptericola croceus]